MAVDFIAKRLRQAVLVIVAVAIAACSSSSNSVSMADAGPDQSVGEGAAVTLDGSGSTGSGTLTYSWTQTAGTPVMLSDSTVVNPTFTAPIVAADEVLTFQLEVSDNAMNVDVDSVDITIVNDGPTADAGSDQSVGEGAVVTLNGNGSTGSGALTYAWTQTAGTPVMLSDATAVSPTFTAPSPNGVALISKRSAWVSARIRASAIKSSIRAPAMVVRVFRRMFVGKPNQIIRMLRAPEIKLVDGKMTAEVCRVPKI